MNHLQLQVGIGTLGVTWNAAGSLTRLDWLDTVTRDGSWRAVFKGELPDYLGHLLEDIQSYFVCGAPIHAIPWERLDRSLWSEFQARVYLAISAIPHGETRTYGWVAKKVGVGSSRAVGQALRKNPLPILIPCHRVVGSAALGGFMGHTDPAQPEIQLKKRLLDLEGSYRNPVFPFLTTGWLTEPLVKASSA